MENLPVRQRHIRPKGPVRGSVNCSSHPSSTRGMWARVATSESPLVDCLTSSKLDFGNQIRSTASQRSAGRERPRMAAHLPLFRLQSAKSSTTAPSHKLLNSALPRRNKGMRQGIFDMLRRRAAGFAWRINFKSPMQMHLIRWCSHITQRPQSGVLLRCSAGKSLGAVEFCAGFGGSTICIGILVPTTCPIVLGGHCYLGRKIMLPPRT